MVGYGVAATTKSTKAKEASGSLRTEMRDDYLYDDRSRTNVPKREYRQRSNHTNLSESRSVSQDKSASRYHDLRQELRKRRDSRGREVWNRLDRSNLEKRHSGRDRYHPYEKSTSERRGSRDLRKDSQQVWRPKKPQQLDTPTSRISNQERAVREPPSDSQRTVSDIPNNRERSQNQAKGLLITYPTEAEKELVWKRKGKEHAVELSKEEKLLRYMEQPPPLRNLSITEPAPHRAPNPENETQQLPDPNALLLPPSDTMVPISPMEEEFLAAMEEGELDETLTAAQIDYMINELAESGLDDEMLENDDLLGEELASDEEKIDAISQLSPLVFQDKEYDDEMQEQEAEIPQNKDKGLQNTPQGRKKRSVPSPEKKGRHASRKLQALRLKPSPKKKPPTGKTSKPLASSRLPHNEVFPSALSKRSSTVLGSVVSQKPPKGLIGGLALFYFDSFNVKIISSNNRLIDIEATIEEHKVFMSFIYGDPVYERRDKVWDQLSQLSLTRHGPWFMIGDFNEMVGNHEKRGGRRRAESSFLPFRCMLDDCGMILFLCKGNFLSWMGYRSSGKVQCRLDRAVGNEDWHHCFSHTNVEYLRLWDSDHRPVLARISSKIIKAKRNFKFDKRWLGQEGFRMTVERGWGLSRDVERGNIHAKVHTCRRAISAWKKTNQTNSQKKIEDLKEKLERAQRRGPKYQILPCHHQAKKSKKSGHKAKKKNDGTWAETEAGIETVATEYFQNLFTSSQPRDFEEALRYVPTQVTPNINQALKKRPTTEEIQQAIKEINPAPGPDGMTSLFFQQFWDVTANDIISMVKDFYISGTLDPRLNNTNICLIPKIERPKEMAEFRPISLCNVSYKIISKILCKRLKRFLPKLISETQSAFVARRLITDNILIAQEAFHALRTNPSCKSKFMAIKTDMSKAYDRVEWSFLKALMLKMGFAEKWVSWIMSCISSVSYQVLLNWEAKGHIQPSRGLRQGDPLSPFLFIILTEALIAQIRGAEEEGRLTGLKIARNSPPISHLLFADDSLFFCKADVPQCAEVMRIIETYGRATGQQLNASKSSVFLARKSHPIFVTH
ncbi:unnamed protein product [Microthlaspi erraticum]|uniref:Reverse transcriptase domain-containing protein n=1 Tax=Microthlaspi erraticum TaxID=1685480 RepID=A0A6D2HVN1_9BRAS|nr:unnamed protein product [Microthlaspi erraticum]